MILITADHGCDPAFKGTDHTREYVPLLLYGKGIKPGVNLGTSETFADAGETVRVLLGLNECGKEYPASPLPVGRDRSADIIRE